MATSKFTSQDLQRLLIKYNSELRILEYQVDKTKKEIDDINKKLDTVLAREEKAAARAAKTTAKKSTGRRGRPRKTTTSSTASTTAKKTTAKRSPGRPKKTAAASTTSSATKTAKSPGRPKKTTAARKKTGTTTRARKLSEWDQFVIDSLNKENKALISSELLDMAMEYNKKAKEKLTQVQLKRKLNQVLHKLANKRGDIVKTKYSGKGYAYALPDWMATKTKLKKEFNRS